MNYKLCQSELKEMLEKAEDELFNSKRIKFKKCKDWRKDNVPSEAGVYAIFENDNDLIYIGESGNLKDRMNEINRTVNHSFRKQFGHLRYNGIKSRKKFTDDIETLLDDYFSENLFVSLLPVNFGRLEIETYLISKYQDKVINSVKKRKQ
ncbi:GIY-YIG nuclease family protein [Cellulophaga sp. L1A9]|uniref:GIY-YIG nuclease family protein n=1 Tax=Cellulophaga sp. L1A9 TaxID=2686362 RepID=UPI00131B8966|nr:GIY-YIG nuclease family protein [Cellulophaga sp. L1A9]